MNAQQFKNIQSIAKNSNKTFGDTYAYILEIQEHYNCNLDEAIFKASQSFFATIFNL